MPADDHRVIFGEGCVVESHVTIWLSPNEGANPSLNVGDRVFVGRNAYLGIYQPLTIGTNTMIGAYSYVITGNHRFQSREKPMRDQGFTGAPIEIGPDVWIGTHVVIMPGVSIGQGAIIGAGSIVTRNVGAYEIWAGTPARFVKHRP